MQLWTSPLNIGPLLGVAILLVFAGQGNAQMLDDEILAQYSKFRSENLTLESMLHLECKLLALAGTNAKKLAVHPNAEIAVPMIWRQFMEPSGKRNFHDEFPYCFGRIEAKLGYQFSDRFRKALIKSVTTGSASVDDRDFSVFSWSLETPVTDSPDFERIIDVDGKRKFIVRGKLRQYNFQKFKEVPGSISAWEGGIQKWQKEIGDSVYRESLESYFGAGAGNIDCRVYDLDITSNWNNTNVGLIWYDDTGIYFNEYEIESGNLVSRYYFPSNLLVYWSADRRAARR